MGSLGCNGSPLYAPAASITSFIPHIIIGSFTEIAWAAGAYRVIFYLYQQSFYKYLPWSLDCLEGNVVPTSYHTRLVDCKTVKASEAFLGNSENDRLNHA